MFFINEEPDGFSPGILLLARHAPSPLTLSPVPSLQLELALSSFSNMRFHIKPSLFAVPLQAIGLQV